METHGQDLDVVVHMEGQAVTGVVSLPSERRLSDFLNHDIVGQPDTSRNFLKLTDMRISRADGFKERGDAIHINTEAIQMVSTVDDNSARGIGGKDGPKQYPFVQKSPVRTRLRLPHYELVGYLHCASGQEVPQVVVQGLTFLACTDAVIQDVSGSQTWHTSFVAINTRQIYSFREANLTRSDTQQTYYDQLQDWQVSLSDSDH